MPCQQTSVCDLWTLLATIGNGDQDQYRMDMHLLSFAISEAFVLISWELAVSTPALQQHFKGISFAFMRMHNLLFVMAV